jgi:Na+-transporting NADH:ubiquinone oxidoreductase subunit NqrC
MRLRRKLLDVLFIVVLSVLSVTLLLGAQRLAAPAVARYQRMRLKTTILSAASIAWTPANYDSLFAARVQPVGEGPERYYRSDSLLVIEFRGRGLWGMIEGIIATDTGLERIHQVKVMAQEETPGLGDRIQSADYLAGYRDKTTAEPLGLAIRHAAVGQNEVDAISGATLSSQALVTIVNDAIVRLRRAARRTQ